MDGVPELGRLRQLALADWPGVGIVEGDQSIGYLLTVKALTDLLHDLGAPEHQLSQSIDGASHRPSGTLTACRGKWFELGEAGGQVGYPTTDEMDNVDNASTGRRDRCHRFQGGYVSWNIDSGADVHNNGTASTLTVAHLNIHSIRSAHPRRKRDQPLERGRAPQRSAWRSGSTSTTGPPDEVTQAM